jgi:hypothetical protein
VDGESEDEGDRVERDEDQGTQGPENGSGVFGGGHNRADRDQDTGEDGESFDEEQRPDDARLNVARLGAATAGFDLFKGWTHC